MRYKVPQNIDMQDRILGPLTMIQFLYAVVGGGLCYSFLMILPKPFSYILVIPLAMFTAALALLKINERPFLDFVLSFVQYISKPKKRLWHHGSVDNLKVVMYKASKDPNANLKHKDISHEKIEELARRLDADSK